MPVTNSVNGMETPATGDEDAAVDALDVLAEMPGWRLTPERWEQVLLLLDRMDAAFRAADVRELRDSIADLEISGPTRIDRVGSRVVTGIPDQVAGRRMPLMHALGREKPPAPAPKDAGGTDRRR